jgi:hypothetical protein
MALARMLLWSVALGVMLLVGCQQKSTELIHTTGKVRYKGAPLNTGIIVFSPDPTKGESGKIAVSKIEPDGTYTLKTEDKAGASAGWYRVSVVSLANAASAYDVVPMSYLPEKYRDPQQSLLQCEIKPNRDNHLDFNLD